MKYHSFGKSVMTALFVTMFVVATLGCSDTPPEDDLSLQRIEVTSLPKTVYVRGEALDIDDLVVTGTYSDGTTKTELVSLANISGYNPNTMGQQTLTITVRGKQTTFMVVVNEPVLQSITVTSLPSKTVYVVGEALETDGLVVTVTYVGGTTKLETVSLSDISGYNKDATGTQLITVTVGDKTATFTVTVNNTALQSIAITSQPNKTVYTHGEAFDIDGLVVTGTYADNTTQPETVSLSNISGYNPDAVGQQTLTVTVNDSTATFAVTVNDLILQSIAVTSPPTKTMYAVGDELDLDGLVVTGTYADGTSKQEPVSLSAISGYNANTVGQQTVTVTVGGKTATFTVTVTGGDATLQSIAVTSLPTKGVYGVGESLNLSGLVVTGTYAGGITKTETVSLSNISGYNANTVGQQTITVTVGGKTATFTVTITGGDATLQSIAVTSLPTKGVYVVGESLNLSGLVVIGTYADGTSKQETVSLSDISGYDANTVGQQIVTVTVGGKTAIFIVMVNNTSDPPLGLDDLAKAPGGNTADNPVSVALSLNLADSGWKFILSEVAASGKYVSLDLSACSMNGTEFDPGTGAAGADKITALILPNTAKSIKEGTKDNSTFIAFTALQSISGAGVETIGDLAFAFCTSLETVSLPAAITVGTYAFLDCESLTEMSLPAATTIDFSAFSGCTSLTTVSLTAATSIGADAFYGCTNLTAVSLPVATFIGAWAFYDCTSLTSVSLPASLTTVDSNPFSGCSALTTIIVNPANTAYAAHDGMLLNKAETTLIAYPSATGAITLPSIIEVGDYAFYDCTNIISVSLPTATDIGGGAFYDCTSLTSVSLSAATDIGGGAFSFCYSLTEVSLPAAVTIGEYAFRDCTSLASMSLPATPPSRGSGIFYNTGYYYGSVVDGTIIISVPMGAVSTYTSAWGVSADTSAGGNSSKYGYGSNHKAVTITDAAQ
jgi:hypothetical protein